MTVFVCVSDGGGMMFAGRRQSRDKAVTADIVKLAESGVLFLSEYSEKLFSESDISLIVAPVPCESAGDGDFVFAEAGGLMPYKDRVDTLVIYRWNRKYPYDISLDIDPMREGMRLAETLDFVGNSHEKITREIWRR